MIREDQVATLHAGHAGQILRNASCVLQQILGIGNAKPFRGGDGRHQDLAGVFSAGGGDAAGECLGWEVNIVYGLRKAGCNVQTVFLYLAPLHKALSGGESQAGHGSVEARLLDDRKDAVKLDGTVLPYFIVSAYPSVIASDGKLRSQPGKPANNQSYNNIVTNYQAKGNGYWGAGASINTLALIYLMIKYKTKLEQSVFGGNMSFAISAPVAKAEADTSRVLVAATETRFQKGSGVTVGTANNAYWLNGSLVAWAEIKSVEDVTIDGIAYKALNLDVSAEFTTTTELFVCGSACPSGQSDAQ